MSDEVYFVRFMHVASDIHTVAILRYYVDAWVPRRFARQREGHFIYVRLSR